MIKIVEDEHKFYWVRTKAWFFFVLFFAEACWAKARLSQPNVYICANIVSYSATVVLLAVMFSICLAVILLFKNIFQVTIFGHTNSSWLEIGAVT